jgi:hypothetical protein
VWQNEYGLQTLRCTFDWKVAYVLVYRSRLAAGYIDRDCDLEFLGWLISGREALPSENEHSSEWTRACIPGGLGNNARRLCRLAAGAGGISYR